MYVCGDAAVPEATLRRRRNVIGYGDNVKFRPLRDPTAEVDGARTWRSLKKLHWRGWLPGFLVAWEKHVVGFFVLFCFVLFL